MHNRALAGLALVLTVTAAGTTAWANQSPNHGPVPTVTTPVSESDTFPLWSGYPLQREWNQMRDVGSIVGEGATGALPACVDTGTDRWTKAPYPCIIDELPGGSTTGPDGVTHSECYVVALTEGTSRVECEDGWREDS